VAATSLHDNVVLGEGCEVGECAVSHGPIRAGAFNRFNQFVMIGGHSPHNGAARSGPIFIGD